MKNKTKRKTIKHKKTRKQQRIKKSQNGGNCGCNNNNPLFGTVKGGTSMLNPYTIPSNAIPLNTFNQDPTSMTISSRINGGKSRKYKRTQTPFFPRKKHFRGGDALLGSSYNSISSFGTTSGIPFSSNTLFGVSNQTSSVGIADIPFFGKHNLPLV